MQRPFSRYSGIPLWGGVPWIVVGTSYGDRWVPPTDMCPSLYPLRLQSPCLLNWVDLKSASRRTRRRYHSGAQSLWALALGQPGHQSWFLSY